MLFWIDLAVYKREKREKMEAKNGGKNKREKRISMCAIWAEISWRWLRWEGGSCPALPQSGEPTALVCSSDTFGCFYRSKRPTDGTFSFPSEEVQESRWTSRR